MGEGGISVYINYKIFEDKWKFSSIYLFFFFCFILFKISKYQCIHMKYISFLYLTYVKFIKPLFHHEQLSMSLQVQNK